MSYICCSADIKTILISQKGSFVFAERTNIGTIYLNMLQQIAIPQITEIEQQSGQHVICTQDGALPRSAQPTKQLISKCLDGQKFLFLGPPFGFFLGTSKENCLCLNS